MSDFADETIRLLISIFKLKGKPLNPSTLTDSAGKLVLVCLIAFLFFHRFVFSLEFFFLFFSHKRNPTEPERIKFREISKNSQTFSCAKMKLSIAFFMIVVLFTVLNVSSRLFSPLLTE